MSPRYDTVPADTQIPTRKRPEPQKPRLVTITVAIPEDIRRDLRVACAEQDMTIQEAAAAAFRAWIDKTRR